jgi:Ca2+-binding RTX toxin-like protein
VVVNGSVVELGADDGFAYGTFTFDFADGSYTMSAPNGVAPAVFEFDYTIIDGDGDTASATATINIVDDAPDARDDLHTMDHWESVAGNVVTALGTDGGPKFATSLSPFSTKGGGVDKVVDDAAVSEFTYKGSTISLDPADFTLTPAPDPTGTTESVEVNSQANIDASNFSISGLSGGAPAGLGFDTGGGSQGVGVGDDRLNSGESLVIDFDAGPLPYGVDNLVLTMSDFGGSDGVDITIYATDGTTVLGTVSHTGGGGGGNTIDLSAYSGIGSIQIDHASGNDSLLRYVDYDPTPASGVVIDPASGDNGSNLSWDFGYETDLDGNDIIQATVTDSNDGSVFVMRSNGFYEYTPDTGGLVLTPESVATTSAANVAASDLTLSGFDNTGAPANLVYSGNGLTVEGGWSSDRIDLGESVVIDFTSKGGNPYGVQNVQFTLTSDSATEPVTYTIYALDGTTVLGTETSSDSPFTISAADYPEVGRIEFTAGTTSTYVRISDISWDEITNPPPSNLEPVLVDYVLTDSDGQSDTAQLALYTPDQTLTGAGAPVDVSTATTSQANVDADPNLSISIRAGGSTLEYNANGVGVQGGNGALLSSGEALLVTFNPATVPNGVDNLVLTINDFQSVNNDQATVIVTHDTDGDGNLTTDTVVLTASGSGTETLDLSAYSGVTQFDIEYTGGGWDLGLGNVSYQIPPTASMDNIVGGALNDEIIGGAGDDQLAGGDGHDKLSGGDDNDTLSGDAGNDYLSGGDGADTLSGGTGKDTLSGDAGDDIVDGGSGDDVVLGGQGDDLVFGGSGNDRLEGGDGNDVLRGGAGADRINGGDGDDRIIGGSGDDSLVGGGGIDIFALESGDEGSVGTPAVDTIDDFAIGGSGDVLDLSDMLQGEDLGSLDSYLNFSFDAGTGDTTISIDTDGGGTFETSQQIVLTGVDLTMGGTLTDQQILDNLLADGNLIVDQ